MLIFKTRSVQDFESREQQVRETEEYVVQERARLNDFESALNLKEEILEEQKIELVSFFPVVESSSVFLPVFKSLPA
jgi:hypothetical protein